MNSASSLKKWIEPDSIFYTFFLFVFAFLFINGINSFISSSEFWSIYLSQKLFTTDSFWRSAYLKPLFHFILSLIYLFKLNDFYHIYVAKIVFSLNGVLQFFLIYKIFISFFKSRSLGLLPTIFIFLSPVFLTNYFRVRSDQLALTFFLMFLVISFSDWQYKKWLQLFLFFLFPAIAIKHFYFSLLALFFLPLRFYWHVFQKQNYIRKLLVILLAVNIFLWGLYAGASSLHYFLSSYRSELSQIAQLYFWAKSDFIYLIFSFLPFFSSEFRHFVRKKNLTPFFYCQCLILLIIVIHPQKLPFFLASLTPVLYFSVGFFLVYAHDVLRASQKLLFFIVTLLTACNLVIAKKSFHFFSLNNPQLITIERLSNIITTNKWTYLDGMGLLPRAKNIGCFVSPEDETAQNFCLSALKNGIPDAIIVTNRLMGLSFDFMSLEKTGYQIIGPNVFVRKELVPNLQNSLTEWPAPSILFSFEQLY